MFLKRRLDLNKHVPQLLLSLACNDRCGLSINTVHNVGRVFIILIELQLLQNFTDLGCFNIAGICDSLLLEFCNDRSIDILGDIGAFLGLNLGKPFIEVVDTLIGVI